VRFALAQKVNVNSIETADKFFVDLLPATWNGSPPPLPHEVLEELARRAREAEHLQHMAQLAEQRRKRPQCACRLKAEAKTKRKPPPHPALSHAAKLARAARKAESEQHDQHDRRTVRPCALARLARLVGSWSLVSSSSDGRASAQNREGPLGAIDVRSKRTSWCCA
jgi:hypothetical protein